MASSTIFNLLKVTDCCVCFVHTNRSFSVCYCGVWRTLNRAGKLTKTIRLWVCELPANVNIFNTWLLTSCDFPSQFSFDIEFTAFYSTLNTGVSRNVVRRNHYLLPHSAPDRKTAIVSKHFGILLVNDLGESYGQRDPLIWLHESWRFVARWP